MNNESPVAVLFNARGIEATVSASQVVSGTQPGIVMFGSGTNGAWQYFKVTPQGDLYVTGTLGITSIDSPISVSNFPTTQSVYIGQISPSAVQTITGSTFVFNNASTPMWVTGSQGIFAVATLPVSISIGPTFPVTQSIKIDQTITLPVSISNTPVVNQGTSGSQSWKTTLYNPSGLPVSSAYGQALPVQMPFGHTTIFGRFRTSDAFIFADFVNTYGYDSYEYSTSSVGFGGLTSVLSQSAIQLYVGSGSTDHFRLRSNTYYRYQAGREHNIKITCYHERPPMANHVRRWGYYDDDNGTFFCVSGTNFGIYRRTSALGGVKQEFFTSQSAFNIDRVDGTGPSGVTLNLSNGNLYEMRIGWLGVAGMNYFINDIPVHKADFSNTIAGPYMGTATLPIAASIENTGATTGSGSFVWICSSVGSEGGQNPPHRIYGAGSPVDTTVSTETALLAIRPGLGFSGRQNRTLVLPALITISTEGQRASYRVVLNPTYSVATWNSASAGESCVEVASGSITLTDGVTLFRGFLPGSSDVVNLDLDEWFAEDGTRLRVHAFGTSQDSLAILGTVENGPSTAMRASVIWKEVK